jgi:hypothetical protein
MLSSNPEKINVEASVKTFRHNWDQLYKKKVETKSKEEIGIVYPLLKSFGLRFLWANVIAIVHYTIVFVSPQVN